MKYYHNNKIAVLLTVHNRKDTTLSCLNKLFHQKHIDGLQIDVYLTDDGCTDGTSDAIENTYPSVNIIKGDGNLFWNRGMIAAWTEAEKNDYDYYLLLNDDTTLFDKAIYTLLNFNHTSLDFIRIGATVDKTMSVITYGGRSKYNGLITNINGPTECDTFNGNVVLIPRIVYQTIGKLDSTFHHGIGDSDYGLRATTAGFKCIIAPHPVGICESHKKLPKWCDPSVPILKRIKYLYMPGGNGNNPIQFFIFRNRHYGLFAALKTLITNHIRVLFPNIHKKDADKY